MFNSYLHRGLTYQPVSRFSYVITQIPSKRYLLESLIGNGVIISGKKRTNQYD